MGLIRAFAATIFTKTVANEIKKLKGNKRTAAPSGDVPYTAWKRCGMVTTTVLYGMPENREILCQIVRFYLQFATPIEHTSGHPSIPEWRRIAMEIRALVAAFHCWQFAQWWGTISTTPLTRPVMRLMFQNSRRMRFQPLREPSPVVRWPLTGKKPRIHPTWPEKWKKIFAVALEHYMILCHGEGNLLVCW